MNKNAKRVVGTVEGPSGNIGREFEQNSDGTWQRLMNGHKVGRLFSEEGISSDLKNGYLKEKV